MTRTLRAPLAACALVACTVAGAQVRPVLPEVRDEGVTLGFPYTIDFTGAGVTCARVAKKVTCSIAGGGGALPSTTSLLAGDGAGGAAAFAGTSCAYAVKTLGTDGAATCTSAPTIPTDTSAASFVTTATEATLSGERVITAGSGTTVNTGTAGQVKIDVTTPVASASTSAALSANYVASVATTAPLAGGAAGSNAAALTLSVGNATAAAAGVVVAPTCGAGNHYASVSAGTLQCTADAGGGGGAPTTAAYWVGAADGALSAEKDLSGFTGIVKNTAGTPSLAASGTDYGPPTSASGTGVVLSTTTTGAHSTIPGTTTTVLHGNAAGLPTYGSVVDADLSGAVGVSHGGLGAAVTPAAGTLVYGASGTTHGELAAGTAGQVLRSGGAGAPVWVGVQSCTSSAATTCTITVARSGCLPVCMNSTAVSTWVRGTVSTTTLTCTFSTSGTNTCNCLCP